MIKVNFNGDSFDLPTMSEETAREILQETYPEIANANASTDDEGNITFRTASGEKGLN